MSRARRIFAVIAVSLAVLLFGSGLLLAASIATSGLVNVKVENADTHLHVPVPAALFEVGIALAPHCLPAAERARIHERLAEDGHGRAAIAMLEALADCPDAVLVDVVDGGDHGDHVQITKRGRNLAVVVHGADGENVDVTLPADLLPKLLRSFS